MMESGKGNLFTRDDTFFGVCEGLGEDLRIPSNLFRVGFGLAFFFSPVAVVIVYLALGALVLVSRLVFPKPRAAKLVATASPAAIPAEAVATPQPLSAPAQADEQMDLELLPIAA
jgi:phage shock protein PspC (stress-responsive transcriptional regulator)